VRRLRAGLVTPHSGGLGTRPGGTRTPPRGASLEGAGKSVPPAVRRGRPKGAALSRRRNGPDPGSADPRTEIAAMERRVARALRKGRARRKAWTDGCAARRSIPSALAGGTDVSAEARWAKAEREDGVPGAAKNTGASACPLSYPSPERGGIGGLRPPFLDQDRRCEASAMRRSEANASRGGVIVQAPPPAARTARGCPPPQAGEG
jgi:hypothetical protein